MDSKDKQRTPNSGFALLGLTCFVETFVQDSIFVLRMNSSAKNPPQRKAAFQDKKQVFYKLFQAAN